MQTEEPPTAVASDEGAPQGPPQAHIIKLGLDDQILLNPYADAAESFDASQPPLVDRVVDGMRFRVWTNLGIPHDHPDAYVAFAAIKWRLDNFVPELWVADGDAEQAALALRIEAFLEAQRYDSLAPKPDLLAATE